MFEFEHPGPPSQGPSVCVIAIAGLWRDERLWFHIDGAFGALARLAPSLAPQVHGIARRLPRLRPAQMGLPPLRSRLHPRPRPRRPRRHRRRPLRRTRPRAHPRLQSPQSLATASSTAPPWCRREWRVPRRAGGAPAARPPPILIRVREKDAHDDNAIRIRPLSRAARRSSILREPRGRRTLLHGRQCLCDLEMTADDPHPLRRLASEIHDLSVCESQLSSNLTRVAPPAGGATRHRAQNSGFRPRGAKPGVV